MVTHEEIVKWSTAHPEEYACHESVGRLIFDPRQGTKHFDPWWSLLMCDDEISRYYGWHLKRWGKPVYPNKLWGTHVSVIKHEEPPNKKNWGKEVDVRFRYAHFVRCDNGKHAWVDVYSPELSAIRQEFGFPPKPWFHLTIGLLWLKDL